MRKVTRLAWSGLGIGAIGVIVAADYAFATEGENDNPLHDIGQAVAYLVPTSATSLTATTPFDLILNLTGGEDFAMISPAAERSGWTVASSAGTNPINPRIKNRG